MKTQDLRFEIQVEMRPVCILGHQNAQWPDFLRHVWLHYYYLNKSDIRLKWWIIFQCKCRGNCFILIYHSSTWELSTGSFFFKQNTSAVEHNIDDVDVHSLCCAPLYCQQWTNSLLCDQRSSVWNHSTATACAIQKYLTYLENACNNWMLWIMYSTV